MVAILVFQTNLVGVQPFQQMLNFSFVPINFHSCWPCEWKGFIKIVKNPTDWKWHWSSCRCLSFDRGSLLRKRFIMTLCLENNNASQFSWTAYSTIKLCQLTDWNSRNRCRQIILSMFLHDEEFHLAGGNMVCCSQVQNMGQRSQVQVTALLINNWDRQFPLKLQNSISDCD